MSKSIIALLSFILGGGFGVILMSCFFIAKESDKNGKSKKNK